VAGIAREETQGVTRRAVFAAALVFIVGFAVLTIHAVAEQGVSLLSFVSLFVLVLLGVGVIGALRNPPR
jgi:hypothetical protein